MTERPDQVLFETSEPARGVRLVTERVPHVRSVSIGFWVDVGSRDEPDDAAGAAHLLEHLLFKGTTNRSAREVADLFDSVGGELNAYSSKEHTCYYARVLDSDLSMATDVLCDMFANALLREVDLEAERKVVLEEIHMAADNPEDRVHDLFPEAVWPQHPLGRPVIGTLESVGAMGRETLYRFYREGYVPGRLVIAAAGNVDHDELASRVAGSVVSDVDRVRREQRDEPPSVGRGSAYELRTSEQVHVVWGAEGLSRTDPDRYALAVLNSLYGGGISSRLFQEVREDRGLAYSIFSGYQLHLETGLFSVYAGTGEATASDVFGIVRAEARDLMGGGVRPEEVEQAKGQVKGGLVLSMDDPGGRMARLGRAELVHGETLSVDELLAKVDAVTPDDVTRVARRLFDRDGFTLATVGPVAEGALDALTEPL